LIFTWAAPFACVTSTVNIFVAALHMTDPTVPMDAVAVGCVGCIALQCDRALGCRTRKAYAYRARVGDLRDAFFA